MFVLGHMGFGSKLAQPLGKDLNRRWILFGTILPDLIDKPLYYGLSAMTHKRGNELGLIAGTRTFGHTGIFLVTLSVLAVLRKSKLLGAIALGVATHLFWDNFSDQFVSFFSSNSGPDHTISSALVALLYPFYQPAFGASPFHGAREHLSHLSNTYTIVTETLGASILFWDYRRRKTSQAILHIQSS